MKPQISIDFDGVLHDYCYGWEGATTIRGKPVPGSQAFIIECCKYFRVCIYSARSGQPGGIETMQKWLRSYDFPIEQLQFPTQKPAAMWGLDDRIDRFTGTFPDISYIKTFKTWQKTDT